jgi:hypothetical protein
VEDLSQDRRMSDVVAQVRAEPEVARDGNALDLDSDAALIARSIELEAEMQRMS